MNIDWNKFEMVAIGTIGFTAFMVVVYSLGVRFLTNAQHQEAAAKKGNAKAARSELANRIAAYALFALSAAILAYGVFIMFETMYTKK
ncbi:MAG: hypothetical protein RL085_290 [Actinomycetota bacterium]|jgi:hypothetical protein